MNDIRARIGTALHEGAAMSLGCTDAVMRSPDFTPELKAEVNAWFAAIEAQFGKDESARETGTDYSGMSMRGRDAGV